MFLSTYDRSCDYHLCSSPAFILTTLPRSSPQCSLSSRALRFASFILQSFAYEMNMVFSFSFFNLHCTQVSSSGRRVLRVGDACSSTGVDIMIRTLESEDLKERVISLYSSGRI